MMNLMCALDLVKMLCMQNFYESCRALRRRKLRVKEWTQWKTKQRSKGKEKQISNGSCDQGKAKITESNYREKEES